MLGWLKKGETPTLAYVDLSESVSNDVFDKLDLPTIISIMESQTKDLALNNLIQLVQRIIELAFFDPHLDEAERTTATNLCELLVETVEQNLASYPDRLEAFQTAYKTQLSGVEICGVGSLMFKLMGLPNDQVVPEIIKTENAVNLPIFLENFDPDTWTSIYPTVLKSLIQDRRLKKIDDDCTLEQFTVEFVRFSNGVLTLNWLLLMRDHTAMNVINSTDKESLYRLYDDYGSTREVLVRNGLIPQDSNAVAFNKKDALSLADLMRGWATDASSEFAGINIKNRRSIIDEWPKEVREDALFILFAMRIVHLRMIIREALGEDFQKEVFSLLPFKTLDALDEFEYIIQNMKDENFGDGHGLHWLVSARYLEVMDDHTLSEDKRMEIISMVADCVKDDWIISAHYVRFLLRYWGKPIDSEEEAIESMIEDVVV